MPALEPLDQRLRRRQAHQRIRLKVPPGPLLGRSTLDVPARRGVYGQDRHLCRGEGFDDGGKGVAERAAEGEAEDCVDDVVGFFEGGGEVGGEGDGEGFELGC